MNRPALVLWVVLIVLLSGCAREKISPHVVQLSVNFTWEGLKPCGWGNPEVHFAGVPANTKTIHIHMYDHAYSHDHGTGRCPTPVKRFS